MNANDTRIPEVIVKATPEQAAEPAHLTPNGAVVVCVDHRRPR